LQAEAGCLHPSLSADGRYVAFDSTAMNLAPGASGFGSSIFLRDTQENTLRCIGVSSTSLRADWNENPTLSADGRSVAFNYGLLYLEVGRLLPEAVFVADTETGFLTRADLPVSGPAFPGAGDGAALSADGRFVAFRSGYLSLVPGGVSGLSVYRRGPLPAIPFSWPDAATALRVAAGLTALDGAQTERLNVARNGTSTWTVDMQDAMSLTRSLMIAGS
jgi:hypothetical protein